ncbi:MAG: glycerol-3-phosphate dehydrogenase/oxidase [Chitinophagales bacterium]|nr:glycerol-3-phosphate dehydrogenase/oxidase [Chitinophagales bacterium]MDW8418274.1 glycerol-3-phosphate dehydrogenase/oxidase [Chitinophagales bacterium]
MQFSHHNRHKLLHALAENSYDVLVIGGGITGCGIALDAALQGMRVALIEKNDFAFGTSSRSTKLIHGGLRYLKQLEFKLVRDVGTERAVVHRNARHLVVPEKMLLPIVRHGSLGELSTSAALLVYDLLAGVKRSEWRKMLNRHDTLRAEPLLDPTRLLGGGLYYEYRTDDSRLTIEIAKKAFSLGAVLVNYLQAEKFIYEKNKICGVIAIDPFTGNEITIRATAVVNAAGPWVDLLRKKDNSLQGKRLQLTKGVHLVFPHEKLPVRQAIYFDVPDGRMIFAIPRQNITYVGTTDTVYHDDIDHPLCTEEDARYLLHAVNAMFPSVHLQISDIISSWAGLRPLIHEDGKSPSELSRKDEVIISANGLISIAGGKLTGYRLMAQKTVNLLRKYIAKKFNNLSTRHIKLSGSEFEDEEHFLAQERTLTHLAQQTGIAPHTAREWFYRYGSNTDVLIRYVSQLTAQGTDLNTAIRHAEWLYALEHEMVMHPSDFFVRRTGKLFFDRAASLHQVHPFTQFLAQHTGIPAHQAYAMEQETLRAYHDAVRFIA